MELRQDGRRSASLMLTVDAHFFHFDRSRLQTLSITVLEGRDFMQLDACFTVTLWMGPGDLRRRTRLASRAPQWLWNEQFVWPALGPLRLKMELEDDSRVWEGPVAQVCSEGATNSTPGTGIGGLAPREVLEWPHITGGGGVPLP